MADLKPCPFCGRIPVIEDCGTNRYFIRCKCGIAQDKLYAQRCDAVRRWNTIKVQKYDILKVNDTTLTVADVLDCVIAELEGTSIDGFKNNPTIEPRKGKWIKMSDADGDYYVCDQCGEELPRYTTEPATWDNPYPPKYSVDKTNFCPHCGADMRERS